MKMPLETLNSHSAGKSDEPVMTSVVMSSLKGRSIVCVVCGVQRKVDSGHFKTKCLNPKVADPETIFFLTGTKIIGSSSHLLSSAQAFSFNQTQLPHPASS